MIVQRKKLEKQQGPTMTQRAAAEAAEAAQAVPQTRKRAQKPAQPTQKPAQPAQPASVEPPRRVVRVPLSTRIDLELDEAMNRHHAHTRTSKQAMVEEGIRLYLQQQQGHNA